MLSSIVVGGIIKTPLKHLGNNVSFGLFNLEIMVLVLFFLRNNETSIKEGRFFNSKNRQKNFLTCMKVSKFSSHWRKPKTIFSIDDTKSTDLKKLNETWLLFYTNLYQSL